MSQHQNRSATAFACTLVVGLMTTATSLALLPATAQAHVGHLGELAGHSHWAGAALLAGAAALAGIAALKGRKRSADTPEDTAEEASDAAETEAA
ncbi:phage holin family protein [Roseibium sp. CAU 1637]|uniref:Phage holin family protein n=1 Tax=Roseibium limicola TaxID=2816037 RepID=A0A939J9P3_9HYPH|nr:DUF6732 family protein [Roseibium limicola]MBO0345593.1 phage holin family protein [Roseibium limicola]